MVKKKQEEVPPEQEAAQLALLYEYRKKWDNVSPEEKARQAAEDAERLENEIAAAKIIEEKKAAKALQTATNVAARKAKQAEAAARREERERKRKREDEVGSGSSTSAENPEDPSPASKRRGRPLGSKNRPKVVPSQGPSLVNQGQQGDANNHAGTDTSTDPIIIPPSPQPPQKRKRGRPPKNQAKAGQQELTPPLTPPPVNHVQQGNNAHNPTGIALDPIPLFPPGHREVIEREFFYPEPEQERGPQLPLDNFPTARWEESWQQQQGNNVYNPTAISLDPNALFYQEPERGPQVPLDYFQAAAQSKASWQQQQQQQPAYYAQDQAQSEPVPCGSEEKAEEEDSGAGWLDMGGDDAYWGELLRPVEEYGSVEMDVNTDSLLAGFENPEGYGGM
ncbi:hypothetical protein SMACR_06199 [Sordaria macrospora]|uniref:WGS project CABT00000000 data, contig 2.3 n=2 Tax=Sordaria macrospora TaxID=5147 RepID=F7VP57_SORMK|nr:uncharacterized protein SMAC_06199 [Sordaria macrospora k-hell]KAA8632023.1 hypothetical protein SMACR_06199 [Sordaria macrospora]KAH7626835.1 hypothetical protein B0T09DRAFT_391234 [Sordaria sp. MPI-SDFR-AT-0083]WPJ64675.1 hypothetical protein SMAC4_06199 [Sordaria macrospora]CCC07284.1 unnamed protein product [Sordaria macrospora k-hell]